MYIYGTNYILVYAVSNILRHNSFRKRTIHFHCLALRSRRTHSNAVCCVETQAPKRRKVFIKVFWFSSIIYCIACHKNFSLFSLSEIFLIFFLLCVLQIYRVFLCKKYKLGVLKMAQFIWKIHCFSLINKSKKLHYNLWNFTLRVPNCLEFQKFTKNL